MRASWRPLEAALVLMMSGGWIASADEHGSPLATSSSPSTLGALRPQFHAVVRLAGERRTSRSEEELSAWLREGSAEREHVAVRLLDASGRVVFREAVSVPRWLHSETALHGETAQALPAEDVLVPLPGRAFVVRVPFVEGSRLRMSRGTAMEAGLVATPADQEFSADAIAEDARPSPRRIQARRSASRRTCADLRKPGRPARHGRRIHGGPDARSSRATPRPSWPASSQFHPTASTRTTSTSPRSSPPRISPAPTILPMRRAARSPTRRRAARIR